MQKELIKIVSVFAFFIIATACFSQSYSETAYSEHNRSSSQDYTIYTSEYKVSKSRLELFLQKKNFVVLKQTETKISHFYEFQIPKTNFPEVDSIIVSLGYVSNKYLSSSNTDAQLDDAKLDLEFQLKKKSEYEQLLVKIDSVKSNMYITYWEKIRNIETAINDIQKKIKSLERNSPIYIMKVTIYDEQDNPTNSKVNFVNMPGADYSFLFIENPKNGISQSMYSGVSLKYLFTKGKSYFALGALKAAKTAGDSLTYNQMFNLSFGQDFYGKHFGRGNNKFMNLYVNYAAGLSFLFNKTDSAKTIFYVNPGVGVELIKSKYILLDLNTHYYLPLNGKLNLNMRGWLVGCSFNFVF